MEDQFAEEDQLSQQIIQNLILIVKNNKQIITDLENDIILYDEKLDELAQIPIIQKKIFQKQNQNNDNDDKLEPLKKQQQQRNQQPIKYPQIQTKKIQKLGPIKQTRQQQPLRQANKRSTRQSNNQQLMKVEQKSQYVDLDEQEKLQQQLLEEILSEQNEQQQDQQEVKEEEPDIQHEQYHQNLQVQLEIYNKHQKDRQNKIANKQKSEETLQNRRINNYGFNCLKCKLEFQNLKALKRHFCD
ncbi:hypothetical protein pb186bvf_000893 [Paramecium bursaria]